ncbi:hypothetical protein ACH5RR_012270 [Cinchona calisaya]|uniref:F-box domain-containing protein n=1 Tax=Cinchona calisaya TaxID=153742 RepID=A0ABD3A8T7_9GENT
MKRTKATEGKLYLPEGIIHHIMSYLNPKEEAQVAVLSKEWLSAWQLKPKLKFDDQYFEKNGHLIRYTGRISGNCPDRREGKQKFKNYVNSTLLRYQKEHRHIIEELNIDVTFDDDQDGLASVLDGWLEIAVEKGVKVIELSIKSFRQRYYKVPNCILKAESLTNLSLSKCKFQKKLKGELMWANLLSLDLHNVRIGDKMFRAIISGCPLINDLSISNCSGLTTIKVINLNSLREFNLYDTEGEIRALQIDAPSLQSMELDSFDNQSFLDEYVSHTLKDLSLTDLCISDTFFSNLINKIPHLEILEVEDCYGFERISLKNNSLKRISLNLKHTAESLEVKVELDAPNLVKLHYGGYANLQNLSISSKPLFRDISITSPWPCIDASCFLKFNGIISNLSPHKVSLCILSRMEDDINESIGYLPKFAVNAIEVRELELYVETKSSTGSRCGSDFLDNLFSSTGSRCGSDCLDNLFSHFLDGLFWACHPKTIVQNWNPTVWLNSSDDTDFIKFLYRKLVKERRNEELHNLPFWQHDLKKVEFEIYDKNGEKFCQQEPLDWNNVPKASKVLFKLEWQQVNSSPRKAEESDVLNHEFSNEN